MCVYVCVSRSREKQKMLKDHSLSAASPTATATAAAASDPLQDAFRKPVAELRVSEAEQRLGKHR